MFLFAAELATVVASLPQLPRLSSQIVLDELWDMLGEPFQQLLYLFQKAFCRERIPLTYIKMHLGSQTSESQQALACDHFAITCLVKIHKSVPTGQVNIPNIKGAVYAKLPKTMTLSS